jgi:hypothetical protein
MRLTPQYSVGHGSVMPEKKDRRHENPGRPKLKLSEKTAARETKVRMSVATDKAVRAAVDDSGIGLGEWLRRAVALVATDADLRRRVAQNPDPDGD